MAQARDFKKLLADQKKNKQKEVISISEASQGSIRFTKTR